MKVAVLGRTHLLLEAAELVRQRGHQIVLVGTCRSEPNYRAHPADFARFAAMADAPYFESHQFTEAVINLIRTSGAEIAISTNWLSMIPQSVIDLFPRGILNGHTGDLPRYRGNACPNWAILAGESHIGTCVHLMTANLDAGDVILRNRLSLTDDTYIGDVYDWLDRCAPMMLADAVDGLATDRLRPEPQVGDILRVYPRRAEDGHIIWSQPAASIHRLIRASSRPFAGAFTTLEADTRFTIWRAKPLQPPTAFMAVPGQVLFAADEDPVIATGQGALRLQEIEMPGVAEADAKKLILRSLRNRLI